MERKCVSWFYGFVFLNSAHGDEQRLDAKTGQSFFLKSLNIRPLKTESQCFSICGCLVILGFFLIFFFPSGTVFRNASSLAALEQDRGF